MSEFGNFPQLPGAPIDKLTSARNYEKVEQHIRSMLSNTPTKEEVLKAFSYYNEQLGVYFDRSDRVLEQWANTHRHDQLINLSGGGWVAPENPFYWVGTSGNEVKKLQGNATLWTSTVPSATVLSLAVNPDEVIVAGEQASSGNIHRLDPEDGSQIWTNNNHTNWVNDLEISSDGFIYSAGRDGLVKKFDLDGNEIWSTNLGRPGAKNALSLVRADVLYVGGALIAGSSPAGLTKVDTSDGSIIWQIIGDIEGETGTIESLAAFPDTSYVALGMTSDKVIFVDDDGNIIWKFETPTGDVYALSSLPNGLLVSGLDNHARLIDLDGVQQWAHDLGTFSYDNSITPGESAILYASMNAQVRLLDILGDEDSTTSTLGGTVRALASLPGNYGALG